jgi:hypothetical protein
LRSRQLCSYSRTSQHFMEPEGSLPCSQGPYPEAYIQGIRPGPRLLVVFRNKLIFYGEELLAPPQPPSWRTTPCRLSATAYSIYSQLPTIPGGRLLHPQPEDAPCRGDKGPT